MSLLISAVIVWDSSLLVGFVLASLATSASKAEQNDVPYEGHNFEYSAVIISWSLITLDRCATSISGCLLRLNSPRSCHQMADTCVSEKPSVTFHLKIISSIDGSKVSLRVGRSPRTEHLLAVQNRYTIPPTRLVNFLKIKNPAH